VIFEFASDRIRQFQQNAPNLLTRVYRPQLHVPLIEHSARCSGVAAGTVQSNEADGDVGVRCREWNCGQLWTESAAEDWEARGGPENNGGVDAAEERDGVWTGPDAKEGEEKRRGDEECVCL
jgi:hypothetical protein